MNNSIGMRDAFVAALDHRFKHEIGGYFTMDKSVRFYKTSESCFAPGNTRMSIKFPPNKTLYWHTHPPNAGWWPSVEDLLRNDKTHVLFTKFGTWIWYASESFVAPESVYAIWNGFHKYMELITQSYWTPERIMDKIKVFERNVKKCCKKEITFVPLFYYQSENDIQNHVEIVKKMLIQGI